ncbi:MAG: hypothetical protein CHACPFDD_02523 [Phycisphaerae bacterium]|nr:hypothetical protein [Phycisphaerae bacterium]
MLKTFFVPLFIIPTGSMAETLRGAHGGHTCPNCGRNYEVGFDRAPGRPAQDPDLVQCPNCRFQEIYGSIRDRLQPTAGDRIIVHGWNFECAPLLGASFGPRRWDVVVFKNPNEPEGTDNNYIKRLIGLPGDTLEIIDGDIWVNDRIARKPHHTQETLWWDYYDHDLRPRAAGANGYFPHWAADADAAGWQSLDSSAPHFDGLAQNRGQIRFLTQKGGRVPVCEINDVYGYNWHSRERATSRISDVRLSCEVQFEQGDGFVELATTKAADRFLARVHADGRVVLAREPRTDPPGTETIIGEARVDPTRPLHVALAVVDWSVAVEIDQQALIGPTSIDLSAEDARRGSTQRAPLEITIAAQHVRADFRHLLIERDVYYTNARFYSGQPGHATQGNPLTLGPAEYFVMGDNSPESLDARLWDVHGPHLPGRYRPGTVPADQLIGRAFFVYWPGFLPIWSGPIGNRWISGPNILLNLADVRWIH